MDNSGMIVSVKPEICSKRKIVSGTMYIQPRDTYVTVKHRCDLICVNLCLSEMRGVFCTFSRVMELLS